MYDLLLKLKKVPVVPGLARMALRLVPDRVVVRDVPRLGQFHFRYRRHRWLLGRNCWLGHAPNFAIFRELVRPGDVVYDIGANIGYYSRFFLQEFEAGRLIAFEPMRENFELLSMNLNPFADRAMAFDVAVSDVESTDQLHIDTAMGGTAVLNSISQGQASKGVNHAGGADKTETVRTVRLDQFIADNDLPKPDVVKIDVEGAEVNVLRGMIQTLAAKPRLAIALHGPAATQGVTQIIHEMGGKLESIDASGKVVPFIEGKTSENNVLVRWRD